MVTTVLQLVGLAAMVLGWGALPWVGFGERDTSGLQLALGIFNGGDATGLLYWLVPVAALAAYFVPALTGNRRASATVLLALPAYLYILSTLASVGSVGYLSGMTLIRGGLWVSAAGMLGFGLATWIGGGAHAADGVQGIEGEAGGGQRGDERGVDAHL
jgi:hypothetical protein